MTDIDHSGLLTYETNLTQKQNKKQSYCENHEHSLCYCYVSKSHVMGMLRQRN